MKITEVIELIRATPDCIVFAPTTQPAINSQHILPNDVAEFYQHCGGLVLFQSISFPLTILPPQDVVLANPKITCLSRAELLTLDKDYWSDDISWAWYTIAENGNGDYFTIDLNPQRLGLCYDSYYETHASVGDTPIVARSFTSFLIRMRQLILDSSTRLDKEVEDRWHWPELLSKLTLGDAYD